MRARVQWIAIAFPAVLVGAFEFIRHHWLEPYLPGVRGNVLAALLVAAAVYGFVRYFTGVVARTEQELGRARAEAAVLAERQRIAREMHDGVAQALFHLRVRLAEIEEQAARGALAEVRRGAARLREQVSAAYEEVRGVVADLKRQAGSEDPAEALRREATRVADELHLDLTLELAGLPRLGGEALPHLLAIVSEAMANARRHGGATAVAVTGGRRRLAVADNGRGFDPRRPAGAGFGLAIMAERAAMLGGRLEVESEPGRGARVAVVWDGGDRTRDGGGR